jgi:hypothetical protein
MLGCQLSWSRSRGQITSSTVTTTLTVSFDCQWTIWLRRSAYRQVDRQSYQRTGNSRKPLTGPSPRKVRSAVDAADDSLGNRRNSAGNATDISSRANC